MDSVCIGLFVSPHAGIGSHMREGDTGMILNIYIKLKSLKLKLLGKLVV